MDTHKYFCPKCSELTAKPNGPCDKCMAKYNPKLVEVVVRGVVMRVTEAQAEMVRKDEQAMMRADWQFNRVD